MVAGMPRAGTTFLYFFLQQHPQIYAPPLKEINFFSVEFHKGNDWYENIYKDCDLPYSMDVSPSYYIFDESLERIKHWNPNAKVVLGLRRPSSWIVSFYKQIEKHSFSLEPFDKFIDSHQWNIAGNKKLLDFDLLFFKSRLQHFVEVFGENLLVYNYDLLDQNPVKLLNSIEDFYGLDRYFSSETFTNKVVNAGNRKSNKLLGYLMNSKLVTGIVYKLLPSETIVKMRNSGMEKSAQNQKKVELGDDKLKIAEEKLIEADDWFDQVMGNRSVCIGSQIFENPILKS